MFISILFLSIIIILIIAGWLLFRNKKVELGSFPQEWRTILLDKVLFYKELKKEGDRQRFENDILQFLHDVKVYGRGFEATDTDKILVAASAVIPLFGFPGWRFRNVNEVILYPDRFNFEFDSHKAKDRNVLGMVGDGVLNRTMILSKPALHHGFENKTDKDNVGIHEFVHLIDKADGQVDGVPKQLVDKQFCIPWLKLTHKISKEIAEKQSDINPYALTNEAEFFSVVSEYFFSRPHLLQNKHPELFDMLEKIYKQDLS